MTFSQLLDGAEVLARSGPDPEISGIVYDSRRVQPGFLFVARRGETTDGNRYIDGAVTSGAVAVVSDSPTEQPRAGVAWVQVPHGRRALARVSANFYGRPAEKLKLCGITGTNGKTTTAFLLHHLLESAGRKAALIGTVQYQIGTEIVAAPHTTPEPLELNKFFADALRAGAGEVVMEVSSHALEQERVWGLPYDVAIFTNLTRDHLDYHGTMESYFAAKRKLFEGSGTLPPRVSVLNADDEHGRRLIEIARSSGSAVIAYGLKQGDFHANGIELGMNGTRFSMVTPEGNVEVFSPLAGAVNVYNILAASAAAQARGLSLEDIASGVRTLAAVPGRFQRVDAGQPFAVVVDYAHTDDALRNLTRVARDFVSRGERRGRVITLFGCGGDRDKTKRPLMAQAAGEGSDFVVVTSDNPRSEDPQAIIADALPGVLRTGTPYAVEADRRKAIELALAKARRGDIVLIAGKGHEKTQTTREGIFPFDDIEVARAMLNRLGYMKNAATSVPKDAPERINA